MSFYGGIFNQISNAFERIGIRNSGEDSNNFISAGEDLEIKADGREGEFYLDTGNQWIQLQGDVTDNFCKIYHSNPSQNSLSTNIIFTNTEAPTKEKSLITVDLATDTYLRVNNIKYDKAGHISNFEDSYLYFKRVNAAKELGEMRDDISKFKNDTNDDISNFKSATNAAINNFENRLIDQEEFVGRVKALEDIGSETRLKNIEDFVGEHKNVTDKTNVTLCNSIGKIDYLRNNGKDSLNKIQLKQFMADLDEAEENANENTLSVCDYINVLKQEIKTLKGRCDRLEALI